MRLLFYYLALSRKCSSVSWLLFGEASLFCSNTASDTQLEGFFSCLLINACQRCFTRVSLSGIKTRDAADARKPFIYQTIFVNRPLLSFPINPHEIVSLLEQNGANTISEFYKLINAKIG